VPGGIVPTCGTKSCWKPTSTKGFKYTNKTGSPHGIVGAKFKEGIAGKSQVQIKVSGNGGFYSSASTGSLALPVTIQLLIDDVVSVGCKRCAAPRHLTVSGRRCVERPLRAGPALGRCFVLTSGETVAAIPDFENTSPFGR